MTQPSSDRNIAAVERETGLAKDTLRVWEKRYGFPQPLRDAAGDRRYPAEQVEQLLLIRRLLDAGQRPGKVVGMDLQSLQARLAEVSGAAPAMLSSLETGASKPVEDANPALESYLAAISNHDGWLLTRMLTRAQMRMGLSDFVQHLVGPLTVAVGEAWAQGRFAVFEEHFYTELITRVLQQAVANLPPPRGARPIVLLTTLPNEQHGLGLLMVEAILALEACRCVSLGTQTPLDNIVQAAQAHKADIVGLSCTNALPGPGVLLSLQQLRRQLPQQMELWVGGSCSAVHESPIDSVHTFASLETITTQIAHWRNQH